MPAVSDDLRSRFVVAAFAEISFGLLGIFLGWWIGPSTHTHIPQLKDLEGIAEGGILGACLGAVLAAAVFALSYVPIRGLKELQEMMETRLAEFLSPMSRTELVVLSMAAGIGEELLFRGWLQQGLFAFLGAEKSFWMGLLGLLLTSLLFGLAHPITPLYIVLATGMGGFLGGIYWLTGNLLCAITAHAVYDAVILLKWHHDMKHKDPESDRS